MRENRRMGGRIKRGKGSGRGGKEEEEGEMKEKRRMGGRSREGWKEDKQEEGGG